MGGARSQKNPLNSDDLANGVVITDENGKNPYLAVFTPVKADSFLLAKSRTTCWRCNQSSSVGALICKSPLVDIEAFAHVAQGNQYKNYNPENRLFVKIKEPYAFIGHVRKIPGVLIDSLKKLLPGYRYDRTKQGGNAGAMNHCEHCDAVLGEFYLHNDSNPIFCPEKLKSDIERGLVQSEPMPGGNSHYEYHFLGNADCFLIRGFISTDFDALKREAYSEAKAVDEDTLAIIMSYVFKTLERGVPQGCQEVELDLTSNQQGAWQISLRGLMLDNDGQPAWQNLYPQGDSVVPMIRAAYEYSLFYLGGAQMRMSLNLETKVTRHSPLYTSIAAA